MSLLVYDESGLHYNYFRTYDPSTGRYLESDPISLNGGLNTYDYARQNPLLYTDALGLTPGQNQFFKCLARWGNANPENCFAQLLADIGKAEAEFLKEQASDAADAGCEIGTCVAVCAVDSFIGLDPNSIMISASGQAAQLKIHQIARASYGKAAAKAVSRAIGWPMTALATGQTLRCSLKCE